MQWNENAVHDILGKCNDITEKWGNICINIYKENMYTYIYMTSHPIESTKSPPKVQKNIEPCIDPIQIASIDIEAPFLRQWTSINHTAPKFNIHPWRLTWNPKSWRFGRSFSFLNGGFVGSMLIFQGVHSQKLRKHLNFPKEGNGKKIWNPKSWRWMVQMMFLFQLGDF